LAPKLARLEDLGYITPGSPLEQDGSKDRSIYEMSDPYFRFWFRYVLRNRSRLESGRIDEVYAEIMADLDNLMGPAYEQCCRAWIERYASEELTGAPQEVGSSWDRKGKGRDRHRGRAQAPVRARGLRQVATDRRHRRSRRSSGTAGGVGGSGRATRSC
jgi:AAA+ ATPase superfamily predicted ATPase